MPAARIFLASIFSSLLLGVACWGQVLNPSQITLLPPKQNHLGIYFASSQPTATEVLHGADIFLRDDAGLHRLTHVSEHADAIADFAVSDDGTLLAYTTSQSSGLFVLRLADGRIEHIATPSGCITGVCPLTHIHFAVDDKYVLFNISYAPSSESPPWRWPLYVVDLASGKNQLLAAGELSPSGQRVISDQGKVVFSSADPSATIALPGPPVNVYTIELDKSELEQLTHYASNSSYVARAASIDKGADKIAFEVQNLINYPAPTKVYRANSDGTNIRALGPQSRNCSTPALSSSNGSVAFVCDTGQLYLAENNGDTDTLTSFPYSTLNYLLLDDFTNQLLFTAGPTDPVRSDELDAIFGLGLGDNKLDKLQFQRHIGVVNNTDFGNELYPVPGGVITVEGNNLRSNSFIKANTTPLPQQLAGASLYVNGEQAPILSVGPWEMTAQLPWNTAVGTTSFQLKFLNGDASQVLKEVVAATSPSTEGFPANNNFGCQAAAYHSGTKQLVDQAHPAALGEIVDIIASGLGATAPVAPPGVPTPSSPSYVASGNINVYLNGYASNVKRTVLEPGTYGKYRISVVVNPQITDKEVQITLQVNSSGGYSNSCIFYANP